MKRKYFVRGLGLGIMVTSLLFAIAMIFYRPTLSEEQIRREAGKLGMVDSLPASATVEDELTQDEKAQKTEKEIQEKTAKADEQKKKLKEQEKQAAKEQAQANKEQEESNQKQEEANAEQEEANEKMDKALEEANNARESALTAQDQANQQIEDAEDTPSYGGIAQEIDDDTADDESSDSNSNDVSTSSQDLSEEQSTASQSHQSSSSSNDTGASETNDRLSSSRTTQDASNVELSQAAQTAGDAAVGTGETVEFSVQTGQNSADVGANLYQVGLVEDARDFDRYLETHNYDNNIQNGTFSIKKGSSYEEIAKILTGQ